MRSTLLALLMALLLAAPTTGYAQATEEEEEDQAQTVAEDAPDSVDDSDDTETDTAPDEELGDDAETGLGGAGADDADETAIQEGGYEPDQRGVEDGGDGYEPDQRGGHDEPEEESHRVELSAPASYGEGSGGYGDGGSFFGLDFQLFLGAGLTGLDAAGGQNLVLPTQQGGFGASFGLGLGARLGPVSVGPRFGFIVDPSFVLGTFGLDVQVALMTGAIVPTVRVSVAYATLLGLSDALPAQDEVNVSGIQTGLGLGVRWRFLGPWTVGAELSGGWLHLSRDENPTCTVGCDDGAAFDVRSPGQSDGLVLRLHLYTGVTF